MRKKELGVRNKKNNDCTRVNFMDDKRFCRKFPRFGLDFSLQNPQGGWGVLIKLDSVCHQDNTVCHRRDRRDRDGRDGRDGWDGRDGQDGRDEYYQVELRTLMIQKNLIIPEYLIDKTNSNRSRP